MPIKRAYFALSGQRAQLRQLSDEEIRELGDEFAAYYQAVFILDQANVQPGSKGTIVTVQNYGKPGFYWVMFDRHDHQLFQLPDFMLEEV